MRKTIIVLLAMMLLCGCTEKETAVEPVKSRLGVVESGLSHVIAYDKETRVMYLRMGQGVCAMVDQEGNPLLYEKK